MTLLAASIAGCGPVEVEPEADASQADVFSQLEAKEALVSLDAEGMIVGVEFDSSSHGDDDLAILKEIPTLTSVGLSGSGVTDEGLTHLYSISTLTMVGLEDTNVSAAAVRQLQEALPDCRISYGNDDSEDE